LHAWDGWADVLKRERRVIRFDLAGFGLTGPSPDGRYSPEADVRLVDRGTRQARRRALRSRRQLARGAVAWRTALAEPERVDKLILVDAGGYPSQPTSMPIGVRLLRMPIPPALLEHTLPRFLVEQGLHNIYGDPSKVTQEQIERSIELTQREGNRRALIDRARQRKPNRMADHIADLKQPTLILWGGTRPIDSAGRRRALSPRHRGQQARDLR
jgi:hypothetical protein